MRSSRQRPGNGTAFAVIALFLWGAGVFLPLVLCQDGTSLKLESSLDPCCRSTPATSEPAGPILAPETGCEGCYDLVLLACIDAGSSRWDTAVSAMIHVPTSVDLGDLRARPRGASEDPEGRASPEPAGISLRC